MNDRSGTLNVILHGTFAYYIHEGENKRIDALIPHVPEHVVRAGNWLGETTLAPGRTYSLEGVEPPDNPRDMDVGHNLVLNNVQPATDTPSPDPNGGPLYAILDLKRPHGIFSMRRAKLPPKDFGKTECNLPQNWAGEICTMQVFSYRFKDDAKLLLKNHPWEPAFAGVRDGQGKRHDVTINLHIFSSTEQDHPHTHVSQAFNKCIKLFRGVNLTLNLTRAAPANDVGVLPPGVLNEETEDLTHRMRRLAQLGRMKKDDRDLNQLWFKSDDLSESDPATCGSPAGNGKP
jgi:hypothetical protein